MMILYSPQFNFFEQKIFYTFEKDKVIAELDGKVDTFDFSEMPNGVADSIESEVFDFNPVISAKKENSTLYVELLNFIGEDATEEERFPDWVDSEDLVSEKGDGEDGEDTVEETGGD